MASVSGAGSRAGGSCANCSNASARRCGCRRFHSALSELLFKGFLAVAQVLDLEVLPPGEFQLAGVGKSQFGPQFAQQCRCFVLQLLALGDQSRQIGLGLAVDTEFFVHGFDLLRAGNEALRHVQDRDQSVKPGDFGHRVLLGLPGRLQT